MDSPAEEMSSVFLCFALEPSPTLNKTKACGIPKLLWFVADLLVLGLHDFSWAVLPHVGHFLESDVPIAAYLYNSPIHRKL